MLKAMRDGFKKVYDWLDVVTPGVTEGAIGASGLLCIGMGAAVIVHNGVWFIGGFIVAVGMIALGRAGEIRVKQAELRGVMATVPLVLAAQNSKLKVKIVKDGYEVDMNPQPLDKKGDRASERTPV